MDGAIRWIPVEWSASMAESGNLAHNPRYDPQVRAARPEAVVVGEAVGHHSSGARAVFDAFMASPTHRGLLLDGRFGAIGVGCAVDASGRTWVAVDLWG